MSGRASTGTVTVVVAAYGEHTASSGPSGRRCCSFDLLVGVDRSRP
jgi:hypothetical protein